MTPIRPAALRVLQREEPPKVWVTSEHYRALSALAKKTKRPIAELVEEALAEVGKPRTRSDCVDGPRPCPWVSCRHNLMVEIGQEGITFATGRGMTWRGAKPRGITARTSPKRVEKVVALAMQWWNDEVADYEAAMQEYDFLRFVRWWREQEKAAGQDVEVPELPPEPRMAYSCTLDVVEDIHAGRWPLDHGRMLLEHIGEIMHVTRERVRQLETTGLADLRAAAEEIAERLGGTDIAEGPWSTPLSLESP